MRNRFFHNMKLNTIFQSNNLSFKDRLKNAVHHAAKVDREYKIFGSSKHQYKYNPPISLEKVREFERKYNVILPEIYVEFLTTIGNGGAGPYYGLYSLEYIDSDRNRGWDFSFDNTNNVIIKPGLTKELWNEYVTKLENEENDEKYEEIIAELTNGIIVIGTQGCTGDHILLCKGEYSGQVAYIDWNLLEDYPPHFTGMNFDEWMCLYFEEIAVGNDVNGYGYGRYDCGRNISK